MRRRYHLLFILILLALALLVLFVFPKFSSTLSSVSHEPPLASVASSQAPLLHQYKKEAHVYVGEVTTPTPCYTVNAEAVVRESYPEQVTVNITVTPPEKDVICIQVIAQKKFKIAFQASEEAVVSFTLNGEPVLWQSTEASPDLNLEAMPLD